MEPTLPTPAQIRAAASHDGRPPPDPEAEERLNQRLAWLRHALSRHINFTPATIPYVYPTDDLNVQLEWTIGRFRADLEVNLDTRRAIFGYSDLSSDDFDEEHELDLNHPAAWRRLQDTLNSWAADVPPGPP